MSDEAPKKSGPSNGKKRKVRKDWEEFHEVLSDAFVNFMSNKLPGYPNPTRKQPSIGQLSVITGASERTVSRHLEELDRDINMSRRVKKFRLASDMVLKGLLQAATKGNVHAGKAYLEAVEQMNFGAVVKILPPDETPTANLANLDDDELAAYKRIVAKMSKAPGGDSKPSR